MTVSFEVINKSEAKKARAGRARPGVTENPEIRQTLDKVKELKRDEVLRVHHDNCRRKAYSYKCTLQKRLRNKNVRNLGIVGKSWHEEEGVLIVTKAENMVGE